MPHYENGIEAELGDVILGKPYNTEHVVSGVVVSVTPGTETCNLQLVYSERLRAVTSDAIVVGTRLDYGECRAFRLLARHGCHVIDGRPATEPAVPR